LRGRRGDECCRKNGQACLSLLCSGCTGHHALPRLRNITSNIRASSGYFEPKRVRGLQSRHFYLRPAVKLVTTRATRIGEAAMTPEAEAKILQDLERELRSFEVIPLRTAPSPREQHFSTQPAHRPFTVRREGWPFRRLARRLPHLPRHG
jgi:hypothetical protein